MTKGLSYFITSDEGIVPKGVDDGRSRMTESSMPNGGGDGECGERRGGSGGGKRVDVAGTIAAKHHASTRNILNRETKGVKFNRTIIFMSKLMYKKKVTNQGRYY
jgi:hypothetical protein